MIKVTIKFGTNNSISKEYRVPVTIQQVLNETARFLGFEVNRVEAHLDGVAQPLSTTLRNGDTINVVTKPCGKASK